MARRIARFTVSPELIISAFDMPDDTVIYDIRRHPTRLGAFEFVVIHSDLPEAVEGAVIPEITPSVSRIEWDWNTSE